MQSLSSPTMTTKNELTIRLTESVVFLRTADRTSRQLIPIDSSPSMVRGLLTLDLAKPTRISSIELELQGTSTVTWIDGVGQRRSDVLEEHKIFSASTVFFNATSGSTSRRALSIGPGVLRNEEALEEWGIRTRRRGLASPGPSPPPLVRRISADNSIFQRDFVSHREDNPVSPPYSPEATFDPSTPTVISSVTAPEQAPDQTHEDLRSTVYTEVDITTSGSSPSPVPTRPGSLPPPSSRASSLRLDGRISAEDTLQRESSPSTPSSSRSPLPSQSRSRGPSETVTPPTSESRGRRASRFSIAGISHAILGAVKGERGRSSSPHPPQAGNDALETISEIPRGRPIKRTTPAMKYGLGDLLRLDEKTQGDGWEEFKKGTYTYPISFTIPANSPPTLRCDFGSVIWRLKAHVHRPGAFTTKLTAVRDVTVISCPGEDDLDEHENMIVERQWEGQLQYLVAISGKMFYVGGTIPMQVTFMPLSNIKIHRMSVILEERVDYYVSMKRIGRTDPIHRITLLSIKSPTKEDRPILPLSTSDPHAYINSPFYALFSPTDDPSEVASNLMGPGPWTFRTNLKLPTCASLKFTHKNAKSSIVVGHVLKFVWRVERGDDTEAGADGTATAAGDAKNGKKKLFDITVQTPVQILSCRCNTEWTSLPGYTESFEDACTAPQSCPCITRRSHPEPNMPTNTNVTINESTTAIPTKHVYSHPSQSPSVPFPSTSRSSLPIHSPLDRITTRQANTSTSPAPSYQHDPQHDTHRDPHPTSHSHTHSHSITNISVGAASRYHHSHGSSLTVADMDTLVHRNVLFERLVSGQESEIGEAPPAYGSLERSTGQMVG